MKESATQTSARADDSTPAAPDVRLAAVGQDSDEEARAAADPEDDAPVILAGPSLSDWKPRIGPGSERGARRHDDDRYDLALRVTAQEVPVFSKARTSSARIGLLRAGARIYGREVEGRGCSGTWYEVVAGGYACSRDGVEPESPELRAELSRLRPRAERAVPYDHARVMTKAAPRLKRLPAPSDLATIDPANAFRGRRPSIVERWLVGDYFAALVGKKKVAGELFYETLSSRYLRAADLKLLESPQMHGEHLGDDVQLPLAFSIEESPLFCIAEEADAAALSECGVAEKHARFHATGELVIDGVRYVRGDDLAVRASAVRVARAISPPDDIPSGAKWVHLDLAEQTLVAYEGERPVFATLISSGREGYETPVGLYQIDRKYLSKTMRGADDVSGRYEVGEVPWTMYYSNNYAVHGAYWHNKFGKTKSHGCTNVPPADARWLYYWSDMKVPYGWHARFDGNGTYFYFTDEPRPAIE